MTKKQSAPTDDDKRALDRVLDGLDGKLQLGEAIDAEYIAVPLDEYRLLRRALTDAEARGRAQGIKEERARIAAIVTK